MAKHPTRRRAVDTLNRAHCGRTLAEDVIGNGPVIIPGIEGHTAFFDLVAMQAENEMETGWRYTGLGCLRCDQGMHTNAGQDQLWCEACGFQMFDVYR